MVDIKAHFEKMAAEYDEVILKVAPYYYDMLDAVVSGIPKMQNQSIRILELGCGTGNLTQKVKARFSASQVTCVDVAKDMIDIARERLKGQNNIEFQQVDIVDYKPECSYDIVISTLALHHIREDSQKQKLYKDIYYCLNKEGVLIIGDIILGASEHLEQLNTAKWIEYMQKTIPMDEIEQKWVPRHYETDRPCKIWDELTWLKQAGFHAIDIIWKNYNIAVYGAVK